jgi:hypothetical protein
LIEEGIGEKVFFIGLPSWTEFCGRSGLSYFSKGGPSPSICRPEPPLSEIGFGDASNRRESPCTVSIHRGVAHYKLTSIAGGEKEGSQKVGCHPNARHSDTRLKVLSGNVIRRPRKLAAEPRFYLPLIRLYNTLNLPPIKMRPYLLRQCLCPSVSFDATLGSGLVKSIYLRLLSRREIREVSPIGFRFQTLARPP